MGYILFKNQKIKNEICYIEKCPQNVLLTASTLEETSPGSSPNVVLNALSPVQMLNAVLQSGHELAALDCLGPPDLHRLIISNVIIIIIIIGLPDRILTVADSREEAEPQALPQFLLHLLIVWLSLHCCCCCCCCCGWLWRGAGLGGCCDISRAELEVTSLAQSETEAEVVSRGQSP